MASFVPGGTVGTGGSGYAGPSPGVSGTSLSQQIRAAKTGATGLAGGAGGEGAGLDPQMHFLLMHGGFFASGTATNAATRRALGDPDVSPKVYGAMPAGLRQGGVAEDSQQPGQPTAGWLRQNWGEVQKQYKAALDQNVTNLDPHGLTNMFQRLEELEKLSGMTI